MGFFITFLVDIFFPGLNAWIVYLAIFGIGLIIGGYSAFASLFKEYKELEQKLYEIEDKTPNISVGFRDSEGHLSKSLQLKITPISSSPDFDKMINDKRKQLVEEAPDNSTLYGMGKAIAALAYGEPNPNYKQEIEDYLRAYREYLIGVYESGLDRAFELTVVVENRGNYPANNVSIELFMPKEYSLPKKHQQFDRKTTSRREIESHLDRPFKPEPYIKRLNEVMSFATFPHEFNSIMSVSNNAKSSVDGPLIQHKPEKDFDTFWIWVGDIESSNIWEIPIRITCAELREPLSDTIFLEIKVDKQLDQPAN